MRRPWCLGCWCGRGDERNCKICKTEFSAGDFMASLRDLLWSIVNVVPPGLRDRIFDRRARNNRKAAATGWTIGDRSAAEYYWDQYRSETKIELAEFISERFTQDRLAIFEFGCHCGNVLRLLHETLKAEIVFTGLDPNSANLDFARRKFQSTQVALRFLVGDETDLVRVNKGQIYDLFIVSSVFYCMSPQGVRSVLANARECSRNLLIADDISSLDRRSTTFDECFRHPYRRLLREAGFDVVAQKSFLHPKTAYNGVLLAVPQIQS